ncbi:MAG: ATP synthase F1 subunit delta [Planctomycetota bacterium]
MTEHHSALALTYAESLLELAEERNEIEPVSNDAAAVSEVLDESETFVRFLKDPGISEEERQNVLDKTFGGANVLLKNFLSLLNTRGRLGELPAILDAFEFLLDQKLGKIEVDVTVAEKLSDSDLEDVRQRVGKAMGKDAVVHQYVDPDIIGGLVLNVGDRVIDASVRRQLAAMKEKLLTPSDEN